MRYADCWQLFKTSFIALIAHELSANEIQELDIFIHDIDMENHWYGYAHSMEAWLIIQSHHRLKGFA